MPPEVESKVFALTQQKANFDNLEPDKILGVLEMHESCGDRMINVMQVNPEDITKNKTRKFSKVGSALISSLSKFYNHEPIRVYSAHDAVDFYKKAGFVFCRPDTYSNEMILDA
ncbi:MAG: hypothetical protein E7Z91_03110 [Cyanobacteria bacterium SIG30]|nr:hypothetical protein [Cyanobacteria bacterium SIG30]